MPCRDVYVVYEYTNNLTIYVSAVHLSPDVLLRTLIYVARTFLNIINYFTCTSSGQYNKPREG